MWSYTQDDETREVPVGNAFQSVIPKLRSREAMSKSPELDGELVPSAVTSRALNKAAKALMMLI